jgi:serine/threonine-protein kinase RsbW
MVHYFKVNCLRDNLKLIREFVNVVLRNLSLNEVEINQLILAVDEVCTNVMIHSADSTPENYLEISICDQKDKLLFEIVDKNAPIHFDPSQYKNPTIKKIVKERRKGGIGLLLVNKIMDNVEVSNDNAQNVWRLTKEIKSNKVYKTKKS